ncbi:MAG TPA: hypothetical protein VE870_07565, partial [Bacteroidales bacterium]|nr:hypothetical protein [Bacteroidales bacterium]
MRLKHFCLIVCLLFITGIFTQCEKYGNPANSTRVDEDSDRPDWAGGNTEANDHIKGNDDSGTTRGGDYGDLYALLRDLNGVPEMRLIGEEYYVQPVNTDGIPLDLDAEGELVDPTQAVEVDFGRLNIVRSPQSVLDQAFEEAMKVLTAPDAVITLDFCGRLTSTYTNPATSEVITKTIDSPRENMAIYQYIMTYMFVSTADFTNRLAFLGEDPYNFDPLLVAASCFAAGSDKTGTVDIDEVVYINGFIGCVGLNPIENKFEYDFNQDVKNYFNFGDCYGDDSYMFRYNRPDVYADRYLQFLLWDNNYYPVNENGESEGPIFSVLDIMEG